MRTNERSRNNFVISTAICLMVALNSTVAKSANEQGANKIADAVKAVNSEANKQYDNTDNTKAIRYSGKSSDAEEAIKTNNTLYCYPDKNGNCLNCEGNGKKCKVAPTYEVNGYNLPVYMSVDSNGFIKGLKDVIKPNEKLSANGYTLNLANDYFYRYWDDSKGDYSSAYPFVCSSGYNDVSGNLEQVKKQFVVDRNKYNGADQYVMQIGFKPKYNYDYHVTGGSGYLKVDGSQWTKTSSTAAGGCSGIGNCLLPDMSKLNQKYLNIKTGDIGSVIKNESTLPCGLDPQDLSNLKKSIVIPKGYSTSTDKQFNGTCGDEYIKRYEDSQGNALMTTYTAWFINDKQTASFNPNYRTFDIPSRACYECKSTSIGNYCEETIKELKTYCEDKFKDKDNVLDCIVYRAVVGGDKMRNVSIADNRLPNNLSCNGCLSKLYNILYSMGYR